MGMRSRPLDGPPLPIWVQVWVRGELVLTSEDRAWMRSRGPAVQVLMLRFPPRCVVRCGPLDVLAVRGYHPRGGLRCSRGIDQAEDRWRWVRADRAELVACWRGLTPEVVRQVLDGP